ncbi:MAG: response regulator [Holophaga sp.]|nr:response regulator [Holophaga sp.]
MVAKGRILFVDDEPKVIDDVRRQAALLGNEWELEFADSAGKGLEAFAREPFNVVVADLRMPGMNGAEFLQEVMARYPATIRILVAADADRQLAVQSVGRTHQFLAKPCDLTVLKSTVEFCYHHGRRVGNDHVRELIARIGQLPTVPDLYQEITHLLESDRRSVDELGAVIGRDIGMTAMILKLANSAFFSLRHAVTSANEAVSYLGIDLLKALVLAHGLFGQVGAFRIPSFTIQHLWQHSLAVGAAARRIADAEELGSQRANEFFTAGLLHDIGILILASRFPEDYGKTLEINRHSGGELEASEYHVFGATHSEVGAFLLALWGIPEPVVQAAAFHHNISHQAVRGLSAALAVHVADTFYGYNPEHLVFSRARLDDGYLASLGLTDRMVGWLATVQAGTTR